MKKILIITPRFYPSIWWIEEQVKILWENFKEKWYSIDILTNKYNNNLKNKEILFWLNIYRFSNFLNYIFFLIKNNNYDLIISRQYYKNSFILWVLKFFKIIKSKTIICADSWWENDEINNIKNKLNFLFIYKIYFFFIWKNNYLNCLNIENNIHLYNIYKWKKYIKKFTNIYNWINIKLSKNKKILEIKNILFLWRFEIEKWIFETIEAFNLLKDNNITLNLVWYWDKNIENKIKEKIKNNKNIIFHWKLYWNEKEEIIKNTDLFVFPSYYPEWQPVTITEITLNNIPIITTDVGNNKEIYWNNLLYVNKQDIKNLKEKIDWVISNIKNYEYNYSDALEKIDISNITNQFLKLK